MRQGFSHSHPFEGRGYASAVPSYVLAEKRDRLDRAIARVEGQLRRAIRNRDADLVLSLSGQLNNLTNQRIAL